MSGTACEDAQADHDDVARIRFKDFSRFVAGLAKSLLNLMVILVYIRLRGMIFKLEMIN